MKFLVNEECDRAVELLKVVEQRRELESRESELKTYFKNLAGDEAVLACEGIVMIISERQRTAMSTDLLKREFGEEFVKRYEIKSHYQQVDIVRNEKMTAKGPAIPGGI